MNERVDHRTDTELLTAFVRERDEPAFAALVSRHGPMVFRVCLRMLRDVHAAQDAAQATFLVLVRKARALKRGGDTEIPAPIRANDHFVDLPFAQSACRDYTTMTRRG